MSTSSLPDRILHLALSTLICLTTGCGGGTSGSSTTTAITPTSTPTSTATVTSTPTSTSSGSTGWTISTGANSADLVENQTFKTVAIALGTLAINSSDLNVGSTGSSTPITLNGATVATIAEDSAGLTITSNSTTPIDFALSGSYGKTITIYSESDFKLSLNGATIASTDGPAINIQSKQRAFIVLSGSNTLTDTSTWTARTLADGTSMDLKSTIFSEGPLIFSGTGSLGVTAASKHAICSDAHVRLRNGAVTLTAKKKDGIRTNNAFVMDGGTLTITTSAGKGIKVEGKEDATTPLGFIAINDGTLNITSYDKAMTAAWESAEDGTTTTLTDDPDPRVTINGGTITINTTGTPYETSTDSLSPEGIEAKSVLTITGGTLTINTTDDGLNAGTGIVISGGTIYAKSSVNDAIDSNGTMTISGGIVVADGASGAEGGLDCDSNTFTVTGGTFVGIGGRNSSVTQSVSTQNTVALSNVSAGLLVIKDSAGNIAFAYTMPETSSAVLLSSSALKTGTAYTIYRGGTIGSYATLFNSLYLGSSGYSGSTSTGSSFTISSITTSL